MSEHYVLSLDRCPHGQESIALDDDLAGHGTTITSKCCGRAVRVKSFPLALSQLRGLRDEVESAIDELESEREGR